MVVVNGRRSECPKCLQPTINCKCKKRYYDKLANAKQSNWHDISTAPKDRTIIVGWWGYSTQAFRIARVRWSADHNCWGEFPEDETLPPNLLRVPTMKVWCEDLIGAPRKEE